MSEENKPTMFTQEQVEELIKSREESLLTKARKQIEAEQLELNTTELVKSMSFVDPDNVTSLVKAMTSVNNDLGGVILKCFTDMEDIMKAKDREVEEMREWFAPQQSVEGTPTVTKNHFSGNSADQRNQELNEIVKAKLAEKSKK